MSAYAQGSSYSKTAAPKPVVRSALLRSPLQLLGLEDRSKFERLKQDAKVDTGSKFAEALMDADTYLDRFERANYLAQDSALFLRAGLASDLATIGLFGKAAIHAATLWEGLAATQECMSFCQSFSSTHLRLKNGRCRITFDSGLTGRPGNAANTQYFVALYVYLLRMAKGYGDADLRLYYPGARSAHFAIFPEATSLRSGPLGLIDFKDDLLRSPLEFADVQNGTIAKEVMSTFAADDLGPSTLPDLICEMQRASLESYFGPLTLAEVSEFLELPSRTVQAHLKTAKTSFAKIRNSLRHRLAQKALLEGRSISETSDLLGFDHRQSFSESFSKWEGQSPSVFASRGQQASALRSHLPS